MSEIRLTNIPSMDVGKVIKELSDAYCKIINNKLPIRTLPSVMLWGAPGVGKSQAIRQLAKEIEENTGKRTIVTDVRLLLFNPIDLRGIPTANADKTLAVWLKPQIFQMDDSEDIVNILFLDEISAAPQSVQAAAYQITLDRVIGEHKLPKTALLLQQATALPINRWLTKCRRLLPTVCYILRLREVLDRGKNGQYETELIIRLLAFYPSVRTILCALIHRRMILHLQHLAHGKWLAIF